MVVNSDSYPAPGRQHSPTTLYLSCLVSHGLVPHVCDPFGEAMKCLFSLVRWYSSIFNTNCSFFDKSSIFGTFDHKMNNRLAMRPHYVAFWGLGFGDVLNVWPVKPFEILTMSKGS